MKKKPNTISNINDLFENKIKQLRQVASVWKFVATETLNENSSYKKVNNNYQKLIDEVVSELIKINKLKDLNKIKTISKQLHYKLIDCLN